MKTLVIGASLLGIGLLATGCFSPGPGVAGMGKVGVGPGGLVAQQVFPSAREAPLMEFQFKPEDIVILGPVTTTSESKNILGLVSEGGNGNLALMQAAQAKYPDAEGVMNVQWDSKYDAICMGILYSTVESQIEGTAFKWKRK